MMLPAVIIIALKQKLAIAYGSIAQACQNAARHVSGICMGYLHNIMSYFALGAVTNFSFLRGASHPQEMIETAAAMGWQGIAVSDYGTMAGMVRAHVAAQSADISLLVGVCLPLTQGTPAFR